MTASIRVKNLSLEVPLFLQSERTAKSWVKTLLGAATARPVRQFVTLLDNVSFSVDEGDRVALIGRNGAGKSTLLRVLTGAFLPTRGSVVLEGSKQALLNIKLGFNSQATVMENIYLRGTAMGLDSRQLRELVHPILEFAELQDMAQRRLHTLSSGQRMRLGFAIATSVEQDIILMDEWLGAGDAVFLKRARQRMNDRVQGSKIVVLASHNDNLVRRICNKGLVLSGGRVEYFGDVGTALDLYKESVRVARSKDLEAAGEAPLKPVRKKAKAAKPATVAGASAEAKPRSKLEAKVRARLIARFKARLDDKVAAKLEVMAKAQPESVPVAGSEARAELAAKVRTRLIARFKAQLDDKVKARIEAMAEAYAKSVSEAKSAGKPKAKPKPVTKPGAKPDKVPPQAKAQAAPDAVAGRADG